jgi:tetratricopeptide (TPR) repeat protein
VGTALLVDFYNQIPEPGEGEDRKRWERKCQHALNNFKDMVQTRYSEATLQRLLRNGDDRSRRSACLALGLVGTMSSNLFLAERLLDDEIMVRQLAGDALWRIWLHADADANNKELQRLMRLRNRDEALIGFDALIRRAPTFAEAYNQRALLLFKLKEYQKSIVDCEKVLQLNPCHYGALAGMAQCFMNLRKPRMALKAFRESYRLNPNMQGIEETIRDLENVLGEEHKDDRI